MQRLPEPQRSRPQLPQGYAMPQTEDMLSWSYVNQKLELAQNYWVVTINKRGIPHTLPIWGVWLDNRCFLEGHPMAGWARNIRASPNVNIHLDSSEQVISAEGLCYDVADVGAELHARILGVYDSKYNGYRPPDPSDRGFYVFTPRKVFAWTKFPDDVSRFVFESQ